MQGVLSETEEGCGQELWDAGGCCHEPPIADPAPLAMQPYSDSPVRGANRPVEVAQAVNRI